MVILSNDYRPNLPREPKVAHGGPANFARPFSDFVTKKGHRWVGVIQYGHDADAPRVVKIASAPGRTYYACYLRNARYRPYLETVNREDERVWFAKEIAALRRLIRKTKPDLLFLNGFSVYAWLLLEAASLEGVPIVIQHAGIARVEFLQYRHLYSRAGIAAALRMEQDITAKATLQIFLNEYSRDAFSRLVIPVAAERTEVIPLPFSPEISSMRPVRVAMLKKRTPIVVGVVARWDRIKNHKAVLDLALAAKKHGLSLDIRSVTKIPETPTQARFKAAYRKAITVVPPMGRDELMAFYRSVDVMLLPSHFDVSPTVVMEAALVGKSTLISPTVGWTSAYAGHGMKKWIVDFAKPHAALKTLRQIAGKPPTKAFTAMLRRRHAPEAVFTRYLRAFERAVRT